MTGRALRAKRPRDAMNVSNEPDQQGVQPAREVTALHWLSLAAAGLVIAVQCRRMWFLGDEWDFLAHRSISFQNHGDALSLWFPHNEHWSTLPILVWRALYAVVGINHYILYALPLIAVHLTLVHVLWRAMLRYGVNQWVATGASAVFGVLGSGADDLVWAFQLGFVASILFGFLAFTVTERGVMGSGLRWLPIAWTCAVAALMCSGLAIVMVAATGLVALLTAGIRKAAAVVIVPAVTFSVWYVLVGREGVSGTGLPITAIFRRLPEYIWTGLATTTGATFGVGAVIGGCAVVSLAGWAIIRGRRHRSAVALAIGAVGLYALTGLGRLQLGTDQSTATRYGYCAVALLLPLVGLAITDAMRWTGAQLLGAAGCVALILVNLVTLDRAADVRSTVSATDRLQVIAGAWLVNHGLNAGDAIPSAGSYTTASALAALARDGKLPVPDRIGEGLAQIESQLLTMTASDEPAFPAATGFEPPVDASGCVTAAPPAAVAVAMGQGGMSVRYRSSAPGRVEVALLWPGGGGAAPGSYVNALTVPKAGWLNVRPGPVFKVFIAGKQAVQFDLCR